MTLTQDVQTYMFIYFQEAGRARVYILIRFQEKASSWNISWQQDVQTFHHLGSYLTETVLWDYKYSIKKLLQSEILVCHFLANISETLASEIFHHWNTRTEDDVSKQLVQIFHELSSVLHSAYLYITLSELCIAKQ